jgi:hypothetical protein
MRALVRDGLWYGKSVTAANCSIEVSDSDVDSDIDSNAGVAVKPNPHRQLRFFGAVRFCGGGLPGAWPAPLTQPDLGHCRFQPAARGNSPAGSAPQQPG